MRTREKIILSVLLHCPPEPTRTQLIKWLFLLRQEGPLQHDATFYDFTPYRYGPFSFEAYRDIEGLGERGYLHPGVLRIPTEKVDEARSLEASLPAVARHAVSDAMARYGQCTTRQLLAVVYERYPWYASRSSLRPAPGPKHRAPLAVYTIGYQGKSIDRFLNDLQRAGLAAVIDVRGNPQSRKYGFSGGSLQRLAEKVGVHYLHLPRLGVPGALRRQLDTPEALGRLLDYYERTILPTATESAEQARRLLTEEPSVLLCFEADPSSCHRGRLARRMADLTHLPVVHL